MHKSTLGVKSSAHTVEIVQFHSGYCDLVLSAPLTSNSDLQELPGDGIAAYILTSNKQIFYADKILKKIWPVKIHHREFDDLIRKLGITMPDTIEPGIFLLQLSNMKENELQQITSHTGHIHGMGFYKHQREKKDHLDSPMWPIEAANSTAYQLLGPRNFPTCYAIQNNSRQYVGVLSKLLPGFKPNRDKPLLAQDLEISSLKNMIKKRDEEDLKNLDKIYQIIQDLIPLLNRDAAPNQGMFSSAWKYVKNKTNSLLNDPGLAIHAKPELESFIRKNKSTVTFASLEKIRQTLLKRRSNIENAKSSKIADQQEHNKELPLIDAAIEQLSLILLDDAALYIKEMYRISKDLQAAWVDVDSERLHHKSQFNKIQVSAAAGLIASLDIPLEDVYRFRIHTGLAIALTSRYFMQDPDGHSKNLASNGRNVDGDLAVYPLTYRYKNPSHKPGADDYILDPVDFTYFPIITKANFRYWPTISSILNASADTALYRVSDATQNFFTPTDNKNYQDLEKSPVFNFQKYLQLIIFSLTNKHMYEACARLHMTDNLPMLNEDGSAITPKTSRQTDVRQDLQVKWVEAMANRAQDAKLKLIMELQPVKMILGRHSDLIRELVLDHFQLFLDDRSHDFDDESMQILKEAINPEEISRSFDLLKQEVLANEDPSHEKCEFPVRVSL